VVGEEAALAQVGGFALGLTLHNDVCLPYLLSYANDEQRDRWLPAIARGELILAIAMTEPGTGSDLAGIKTTAIRTGDHYLLNGAKTFITNGINADLIIVAVKTDPRERHRGVSLLLVERGMDGFDRRPQSREDRSALPGHRRAVLRRRRRPRGQPARRRGRGVRLSHLKPGPGAPVDRDRRARRRTGRSRNHARVRARPGGVRASDRVLPEHPLPTGRMPWRDRGGTGISRSLRRGSGIRELTPEDAAIAKWWCTELQGRVLDRCVQMHGGYGYMAEYPIARAWADARATRIFGGTNEIMREIIGRSLGL